jgi:hypothetical protein
MKTEVKQIYYTVLLNREHGVSISSIIDLPDYVDSNTFSFNKEDGIFGIINLVKVKNFININNIKIKNENIRT